MALTDKNIPQCNDEGQASEPDFGDKALMRADFGEKAEKNPKMLYKCLLYYSNIF